MSWCKLSVLHQAQNIAGTQEMEAIVGIFFLFER